MEKEEGKKKRKVWGRFSKMSEPGKKADTQVTPDLCDENDIVTFIARSRSLKRNA